MEKDNLKIKNKRLFMRTSLIFIISLFCVSTVAASSITVTLKPSIEVSLTYKDYTVPWENHCSLCEHVGTLKFGPKEIYKGKLTCSRYGTDYYSAIRKNKHGEGPRAHLTVDEHYYEKNNNKTQQNKTKNNETNENMIRNLILDENRTLPHTHKLLHLY